MRETVRRCAMFAAGQTVLVAVSGGPDSVALLHALHTLRGEWELSLAAAHLDHGFRGAESAADAEYVRELCRRLDIPFQLGFRDVPALKRQTHLSAQEAARKVRHGFLRQAAAEIGAERIALGHTRDDRVETVLLNLLRGTGLEGLGGFPPVSLPLVRPLYDTSRQEVLEYCAANQLQPRTDSSNAKLDYRRNRIRTELLPHLAAQYNDRVGDALLRMAELASADNILLEHLAEQALSRLIVEPTPPSPRPGIGQGGFQPLPYPHRRGAGGEVKITEHSSRQCVLNAQRLNEQPWALRRRIVRQAISRVRGSLLDIRFEMVERILSACERGEKAALELPDCETGPFGIRTENNRLIVFRWEEQVEASPWHAVLLIPGKTVLPHTGVVIETILCEHYEEAQDEFRQRMGVITEPVEKAGGLLFRLSELRLPLIARSWQAGDRMRPHGMRGRKKLQDIFTDRKIPREQRAFLPVIADANTDSEESADNQGKGRILAVLGVQTSDMALPLTAEATEPQKNGLFLLLMALSGGVPS